MLEILTPIGGSILLGYQWLYQELLGVIVWSIQKMSELPFANLKYLFIGVWDVLVLYSVIIIISNGLIKQRKRAILIGLITLCLQQGSHWIARIWVQPKADI